MSRTYRRKKETERSLLRYRCTPHLRTNRGNWTFEKEGRWATIWAGGQVVCHGFQQRRDLSQEEIIHFHRVRLHMDNRTLEHPWIKCHYRRRIRRHHQHDVYHLTHASDHEYDRLPEQAFFGYWRC